MCIAVAPLKGTAVHDAVPGAERKSFRVPYERFDNSECVIANVGTSMAKVSKTISRHLPGRPALQENIYVMLRILSSLQTGRSLEPCDVCSGIDGVHTCPVCMMNHHSACSLAARSKRAGGCPPRPQHLPSWFFLGNPAKKDFVTALCSFCQVWLQG